METFSLSRRERRNTRWLPIAYLVCTNCGWRVAILSGEAMKDQLRMVGLTLLGLLVLWLVVGVVLHTLG